MYNNALRARACMDASFPLVTDVNNHAARLEVTCD